MEALNAVERIIRDLLDFVVAMSVVLAALLVIISRMPNARAPTARARLRRRFSAPSSSWLPRSDPDR